ncbi:universal stress protein [Roseateles sp. BYS87W]|uniref:Universal stress protein n=1 Tax=Pelomonas baiyunensis TaxID=3299026 RepID=A0ABW7H4D3_9BURK
MTLRSLLVALDATPANTARTRIAQALAQAFDAHLIGLAPVTSQAVQSFQTAAAMDGYVAGAATALLGRAEDLAQQFHLQCRDAGLASFEAVADREPSPDTLARHAQAADLLVMGQPDPSLPNYRQALKDLEDLLLTSARPVLLIPYTHLDPLHVRRVVVAWDGSRESVRAMTDALPLLRRATHVTLVHWRADPADVSAQPALASLRQWLAFQGVEATVRDEVTALAVGDALLNAASDLGADLIVMGAYGHARWAERLFGGVSRTLLQSMTVPVLMAH